jgi:hypothetical protein
LLGRRRGSRHCVATLVYVYDHEARELPKAADQGLSHHELSQATLHVHLDEASCLEVTVLKGLGSTGPGVRQPCHRRARRPPRPPQPTAIATGTLMAAIACRRRTERAAGRTS